MAMSELQVVTGIITLLSLLLLGMAVRVWYPKGRDASDASLDAMINGFDFRLPDEVAAYRKIKEESPEDTEKCFNMLFRRAVADIPLIRKIQSESQGIQRLKRNDILKDGSFMSFKMAEEMINKEVADVRREAEELKPGEGWPDKIFPQAVQFMSRMAEQQMQAQRKAAQQQMQSRQNPNASEDAPQSAAAPPAESEEALRKRK